MLKQRKLLRISSILIVLVIISCTKNNQSNVVFDKKENFRYNDNLTNLKQEVILNKCYECEEDNVYFYSPNQIKIDSLNNENINSIYYLYFNKKEKLKKIEKIFLFDFNIATNDIKNDVLDILRNQIYEIVYLDNINKSIEKNGFVYSIQIDTSKTYKTLIYKITTANNGYK